MKYLSWLLPALLAIIGVSCINYALKYGVGVDFGWYGVLFWFGVGCVAAWWKKYA